VSRARRSRPEPKKPCCMVSEILEEAGVDRTRLRQIRRQVLEGIILMCQWQIQRMEEPQTQKKRRTREPRRVVVE
jgi:hypothetical protein